MVGVIRNPASVSCNVYKPATHVRESDFLQG